jgi:hypothetical protein
MIGPATIGVFNTPVGPLPGAFASSGYQPTLSSYTLAITIDSSDNRWLGVHVSIFAAGSVTSIVSDLSGALSLVRADSSGVYRSELWQLLAPAVGTHTLTITLSASLTSIADAAYYFNVDQTLAVEAQNGATGTNTPASGSVTPITEFALALGALTTQTAAGVTSAAGQDSRTINAGALGTSAVDDVRQVNPPAAQALTWTGMGALDAWVVSLVAIRVPQPAAAQVYGWDPGIALLPSPRPFSPALRVAASNYIPTPDEIGGDGLGWLPQYPDRIDRLWLACANQLSFTTGSIPSTFAPTDMGWKGTYPDSIDRRFLLVGQQLAFITGAVPSTFAPTDLSWEAKYPSQIFRFTVQAANQVAFTSPVVATIPVVPDRSWGSIYPDRISRATLHPAGMPFFSLGPFIPLPNPPVTFIAKDRIVLGQKEAFGVTSDPNLGGWTW